MSQSLFMVCGCAMLLLLYIVYKIFSSSLLRFLLQTQKDLVVWYDNIRSSDYVCPVTRVYFFSIQIIVIKNLDFSVVAMRSPRDVVSKYLVTLSIASQADEAKIIGR